jgi:signal transduction histidine kinase
MVLNNQLDEANKVKAKFFGILSHDLRGPVANLLHFLHLQKNDPDLLSPEQQAGHQQKITESAEGLLDTMEAMLLWSKEQMDSFKPDIKNVEVGKLFDYLQKFFSHPGREVQAGQSSQLGQPNIRFRAEPALVVVTDENYLRIIMQNLTANAIRVLQNTPDATIVWEAKKEGEKTILSITDNGPGISDDQAKALYDDSIAVNTRSGFGLHLIRDLAKAIRYKISIQSRPGIGTTFILSS